VRRKAFHIGGKKKKRKKKKKKKKKKKNKKKKRIEDLFGGKFCSFQPRAWWKALKGPRARTSDYGVLDRTGGGPVVTVYAKEKSLMNAELVGKKRQI